METTHATRDAVVLVHGLWMNGLELTYLSNRLRDAGFSPRRFRYGSVRHTIAHNAGLLAQFCQSINAPRIHLVGHSLGGLVILRMLSEHPLTRFGRTVLIATPIRGSSAAKNFNRYRLGHWMLGRSTQQGLLGNELRVPPGMELGVVAGTRGLGLGRLFGELEFPHDGTVTLEETQLEGVSDHLALPLTHSTLLLSKRTAEAVCTFLRNGRFGRNPQSITATP